MCLAADHEQTTTAEAADGAIGGGPADVRTASRGRGQRGKGGQGVGSRGVRNAGKRDPRLSYHWVLTGKPCRSPSLFLDCRG